MSANSPDLMTPGIVDPPGSAMPRPNLSFERVSSMLNRAVRAPSMLAALIFVAAGGPALAGGPPPIPEWVESYAREAMSAPVTLENARKYHFYQLPRSLRSDHPFIYDVDIAPLLNQFRNYGNGQRETLKRLLDEKLATIQTVEEAGPYHGQCSWIMAREGGNDVTQVQIDLDTYCRTKAVPVAYQRLVREHAERLDLRLAQLRNVDVSFPGRFIGTDRFIQNTDIGSTYAKAVEARLGAAQPAVIGELAQTYREKPLSEDPLQTGGAQCQALLGRWYPKSDPIRDLAMNDPLRGGTSGEEAAGGFAQAVSTACKREANAWLMRQQPAIGTAIKASLNTADAADGPVLSVRARCETALGRWFRSFDRFELAFIGPLRQTCATEAGQLVDRDIDVRAKSVAARLEGAPRTLDGLEQRNWFEPSSSDLSAVADPRDPGRDGVVTLMTDRTIAMTRPFREEAQVNAITGLEKAYADGGLTDAGLRPARNLCGPYLGSATRTLPAGGGTVRKAIETACRSQEAKVAVARGISAQAKSNIDTVLDKGNLTVLSPRGETVTVDPRMVVTAAAANGFQVTFQQSRTLFFAKRYAIRITPFGQNAPALDGALEPETRADGVALWRITQLDGLPGIDGPLATLSCVARSKKDGGDTVVLAAAGLAAAAADAPWTAGLFLGAAFTEAALSSACRTAANAFTGITP